MTNDITPNTFATPDYILLPVYRQQRHLAPGSQACVLVADLRNPTVQEDVWLEVVRCDGDLYLGRVCAPVPRFPQLSARHRGGLRSSSRSWPCAAAGWRREFRRVLPS